MNAAEGLKQAIQKALRTLGIEGVESVLERPADMAHGDYATNVALAAAKQVGKNPRELAEEIANTLKQDQDNLEIEVAGPGFINFRLAPRHFVEKVGEIVANPEMVGRGNALTGKTVLVEYTQPNILKPFHIGHLMSNAIGEAVSRVVENAGADVKRLNYQGDVGLHIAKALWGIRALGADPTDITKIGEAYVHGAKAYVEDENAKQEMDELNQKVYADDPEIRELYETGKKTSLARFEELYKILGSKFDRYYFESETWKPGVALVEEGKEKGIFKESEGAVIFPGEDYGLHTRVFITSKGIPVYEAKELGLSELKAKEFDFDTSITTIAVEQDQYFKVVFKALGLLRPELEGRFTHIAHGMMQLSGGKMSSRLGNIVSGESLLMAVTESVEELMGERVDADARSQIASDVAVGAVKYTVLRQALRKNIIFDEEKSLSFEGDSGPYLQYTAVRARSVVEKAKEAGIVPSVENAPANVGTVERLLERFPEAAARAAAEYEPHHVATYAIELASAFNSLYAAEKFIDVDDKLSPYRIAVAQAVSATLERALWLLGIRVPSAM